MSDIVYKNFGFSTPFLSGYRELKIPLVNSSGASAWPELFPPSRIAQLRETVGLRHFSAQMMLEYVDMARARLDPAALQFYDSDFDIHTARIGDFVITGASVYWDPSGGRRKSDGSVCVLIYRDDKSHHIFIHDILYLVVPDEELHPLARQCEMVLEFMRHYNMYRITIETNGIGNALPEIMRDTATRLGATIGIQNITNNKNKEIRILDAIEPVLTSGRLHAHMRIRQSPLISEMLGWTATGANNRDDGLDSVSGAIGTPPIPIRPLGQTMRPFTANTNFSV